MGIHSTTRGLRLTACALFALALFAGCSDGEDSSLPVWTPAPQLAAVAPSSTATRIPTPVPAPTVTPIVPAWTPTSGWGFASTPSPSAIISVPERVNRDINVQSLLAKFPTAVPRSESPATPSPLSPPPATPAVPLMPAWTPLPPATPTALPTPSGTPATSKKFDMEAGDSFHRDCENVRWEDVERPYLSDEDSERDATLANALEKRESLKSLRVYHSVSVKIMVENEELGHVSTTCWERGEGVDSFTEDSVVKDGSASKWIHLLDVGGDGRVSTEAEYALVGDRVFIYRLSNGDWIEYDNSDGDWKMTPELFDPAPELVQDFMDMREWNWRANLLPGGISTIDGTAVRVYESKSAPTPFAARVKDYSHGGFRALLAIGIDDNLIKRVEYTKEIVDDCASASNSRLNLQLPWEESMAAMANQPCAVTHADYTGDAKSVVTLRFKYENENEPISVPRGDRQASGAANDGRVRNRGR